MFDRAQADKYILRRSVRDRARINGLDMLRAQMKKESIVMKTKLMVCSALLFCATLGVGRATYITTWTGLGSPDNWSDAANWSAGVPTSNSTANIVYPAGDTFDIYITSTSRVYGIVYGADLTYATQLVTNPQRTLRVGAGGITSYFAATITQEADLTIDASAPINAGGGLVIDKPINLQTNTLTVNSGGGAFVLQAGTTLAVASASDYGRIAGTGGLQLSGPLSFDFTTATGPGTWDFIAQTPAGTLTSVSLKDAYTGALANGGGGIWTGNYGGLHWTYTASTGVLTAIPEPTTGLLVFGGIAGLLVYRRRQAYLEE